MVPLSRYFSGFFILSVKVLVPSKDFVSNMVVPVGGHLEPHEINNPSGACLREIEEETGLTNLLSSAKYWR